MNIFFGPRFFSWKKKSIICTFLETRSWKIPAQNLEKNPARFFFTTPKPKTLKQNENFINSPQKIFLKKYSTNRFDNIYNDTKIFIIQPYFRIYKRQREIHRDLKYEVEEAIGLVEAVEGWKVVGSDIVKLNAPNLKSYFGTGRLQEISTFVCNLTGGKDKMNNFIIFVNSTYLTGKQCSFLEQYFQCRVFDRFSLILAIFNSRAKSREAHLQVEMADLEYQKTRFLYGYAKFERDRSNASYIGGIGESLAEIERRKYSDKLIRIRKELSTIEHQREIRRKKNRKHGIPIVGVLGYTNAGKTALIEKLSQYTNSWNASDQSGAESGAHFDNFAGGEDRLFATLHNKSRLVKLPSGVKIILMDTIGFISKLPHTLISAFRCTLDEVFDADVILHVRDVSHPECYHQNSDVHQVMKTILESSHIQVDPYLKSTFEKKGASLDPSSAHDEEDAGYDGGYDHDEVEEKGKHQIHPWFRHIEVLNKIDKLQDATIQPCDLAPFTLAKKFDEDDEVSPFDQDEIKPDLTDPTDQAGTLILPQPGSDLPTDADSHSSSATTTTPSSTFVNYSLESQHNIFHSSTVVVQPCHSIQISVKKNIHLDTLLDAIESCVMEATRREKIQFRLEPDDHQCLSWLHRNGNVFYTQFDPTDEKLYVRAVFDQSALHKFPNQFPAVRIEKI